MGNRELLSGHRRYCWGRLPVRTRGTRNNQLSGRERLCSRAICFLSKSCRIRQFIRERKNEQARDLTGPVAPQNYGRGTRLTG